ncbi:hypothetical protein U9M48_005778 [Paspalum notatum var. saurae]|uniref:Reverse transcriptase domain-containing protein n=1 Tax=Paspalum notatum var. saurae TaxID=547442 RepID=A0AAQ3SLH9_PASNO
MHSIRRQHAKTPFFALKIDMMKAYDRVEWNYLKGVLQKLGFAQRWIDSVTRCVTSVRYLVKVNGELSDLFTPTRGLRQEDPISPYLFLLCAEGLSCLLKMEEHAGRIKGTYSQGSGQKINLQKSSLYFGSHCPPNIKQKVMDALNVHNEALQATYLGMPSYVGQSRVGVFNFIVERMWKHVQGWNDKPLSRAGKEVLLKSVAQAIPTYVMSCFKLPDGIYEKMRATISNHWWGFEGGKKKMHWRSWNWLTTPKFMGGMGFRDMKLFNQAMLGRQCWRCWSYKIKFLYMAKFDVREKPVGTGYYNEVAHVLARSAVHVSESAWFHVAPDFLCPLLCNDHLNE